MDKYWKNNEASTTNFNNRQNFWLKFILDVLEIGKN